MGQYRQFENEAGNHLTHHQPQKALTPKAHPEAIAREAQATGTFGGPKPLRHLDGS